MSSVYEKTIDDKLAEITEMLARIEERQIGQLDRVEKLEVEVKQVSKQVQLAQGGVLVLTVLGTLIAIIKSVFTGR